MSQSRTKTLVNISIASTEEFSFLPTGPAVTRPLPDISGGNAPLADALAAYGFNHSFTPAWVEHEQAAAQDVHGGRLSRLKRHVYRAVRRWTAFHRQDQSGLPPVSWDGMLQDVFTAFIVGFIVKVVSGSVSGGLCVAVIMVLVAICVNLARIGRAISDEELVEQLKRKVPIAATLRCRTVRRMPHREFIGHLPEPILELIDKISRRFSDVQVMLLVPYYEELDFRDFVRVQVAQFVNKLSRPDLMHKFEDLESLIFESTNEEASPVRDTDASIFLEFALGSEHYAVASWRGECKSTSVIYYSHRTDRDPDLDLCRMA